MCTNWERNQSCKYGEKCSYAHGLAELRAKPERKVTTREFSLTDGEDNLNSGDSCSDGRRCQYLHNEVACNDASDSQNNDSIPHPASEPAPCVPVTSYIAMLAQLTCGDLIDAPAQKTKRLSIFVQLTACV